MEDLFKQMTRTVGHDSQTFIAMIHAYTDNNDLEGIERLLRIMKKEKVRPTENFYMRLIQSYQTFNLPEKVYQNEISFLFIISPHFRFLLH